VNKLKKILKWCWKYKKVIGVILASIIVIILVSVFFNNLPRWIKGIICSIPILAAIFFKSEDKLKKLKEKKENDKKNANNIDYDGVNNNGTIK
jgi:hypothetical protein